MLAARVPPAHAINTRSMHIFFVLLLAAAALISFAGTGVNTQVPSPGSIIAISTDQPCVQTDQSKDSTQGMVCNQATILELGLVPSESNSTTGYFFQFLSLPDTSGTGSSTFEGSGDQTSNCVTDGSGSQECLVFPGQALLTIDIQVSPIVAKYTRSPTGINIPSAYYYNTTTFPYTGQSEGFDQCKVADIQDPAWLSSANCAAYVQNDEGEDEYYQSFFSDTTPAVTAADIFSTQRLGAGCFLASTFLQATGSSPNTIVQTSGKADSSMGNVWPDDIYRRWFTGNLGAGGAAIPGTDYPDATVCPGPNNDVLSACSCLESINGNRGTTAVCVGGPTQSGFGQRNGVETVPTTCLSGACSGLDDGWCPFVNGFTYGSSRCVMSRITAEEMDSLVDLQCNSLVDDDDNIDFGSQTQACAGNCDASEAVCADYRQLILDQGGLNLDQTIDQTNCYCSLREAKCGRSDPFAFAYPSVNSLYFGYNKPEDLTTDNEFKFNLNNRWNMLKQCSVNPNNKVSDNTQQVLASQAQICCQSTIQLLDNGNSGVDSDFVCGQPKDGDRLGYDQARVKDTPCACGCKTAWRDMAIPVAPMCTVYKIEDPATPMYNVTVTVTNGDSKVSESITVGTAVVTDPATGQGGEINRAVTPDGTVGLSLIDFDQPNGNALPNLPGYIVVCGNDVTDSDLVTVNDGETKQRRFSVEMNQPFVGSSSPLGVTNPFEEAQAAGMDVAGRMPIPSTYDLMARKYNVLANITRNSLGTNNPDPLGLETNYPGQPAWWYYVPEEKMRDYGQGCNQIGWANYGHYDMASASTMCSGRTGTCVPGYDFRGSSQNFSQSMLDPPKQVPAFVGRIMSNYEVKYGNREASGTSEFIPIPEFVPPDWNFRVGNYWVDGDGLFTSANGQGGPAFAPGNARIRIKLSVAGTLLQTGTALSAGKLAYPNGATAPNNSPTDTTNVPLGSCIIELASSTGSLHVLIRNTGQSPATYSIRANCTRSTVAVSLPTNIGVSPQSSGVQTTVTLEVQDLAQLDGLSPSCEITLLAGNIENAVLDRIPYICSITNNKNMGAGAVVLSNTSPAAGGGSSVNPNLGPNNNKGAAQQDFCDSWGWLCNPLGSMFNGISSLFDTLIMWLVFFALFAIFVFGTYGIILKFNEETDVKVQYAKSIKTGANLAVLESSVGVKVLKDQESYEAKLDKAKETALGKDKIFESGAP